MNDKSFKVKSAIGKNRYEYKRITDGLIEYCIGITSSPALNTLRSLFS